MEIVKYIIMGIYAIVCLALIVLIFKQSKEDSGASGTIVGASANNFYEKNKQKLNIHDKEKVEKEILRKKQIISKFI